MRKLIVSTLVTLDGVVEDPGGMAGSERGGWPNRYFNDEASRRSVERLQTCEYFLCGRHTYEIFSKGWSQASAPYADMLNSIPKLVASTTLAEPLSWNASLLRGDAVEDLKKIKEQSGRDILMYGSVTLMRSLLEHALVDQLDLWVCPIVVGSGQRLFSDGGSSVDMDLAGHADLATGIAILSYHPGQRATT